MHITIIKEFLPQLGSESNIRERESFCIDGSDSSAFRAYWIDERGTEFISMIDTWNANAVLVHGSIFLLVGILGIQWETREIIGVGVFHERNLEFEQLGADQITMPLLKIIVEIGLTKVACIALFVSRRWTPVCSVARLVYI
jgi:hypothetical protein